MRVAPYASARCRVIFLCLCSMLAQSIRYMVSCVSAAPPTGCLRACVVATPEPQTTKPPPDPSACVDSFQYSSVESADDEKRVCDEADCLLPQDGVTIVCAPGSINRTLPPGGTPYPSPAPTAIGTYVVIPTSAPGGNDAAEGESIGSGDLNGAVGVVPSIWGVGGLRRIAGVILAGCAAWCATSMPLLM